MLKELREIATDKTSGVSVVLNDEQNYRKMVGTIPGEMTWTCLEGSDAAVRDFSACVRPF